MPGAVAGSASASEAQAKSAGCMTCHVADLMIDHDRRVADVETVFDPSKGIFNRRIHFRN